MRPLRFTLLATLLAVAVSKSSHFHDHNIVCCNKDGSWIPVPDENRGHPPPPVNNLWQKNSTTLIVLIAALREVRLVDTLHSMFSNAANPSRVFAGVVQQNAKGDPDALEELCEKHYGAPLEYDEGKKEYSNPNNCPVFGQVKMMRMDVSEAAGPVYARGRGAELVDDEEFCMQIDAHTIFKPDWDYLMMQQWGAAENEYAVLSTYPTNYKDLYTNSNKHWEMPHLCSARLHGGPVVANSQAKACANLDRPLLAPLWAAGLSFSRCHAELVAPNDPNLRQVFQGEEFARGARLWTHGYDFYSITRPIIGTYYGADKKGKGGWRHNSAESKISTERMSTLLKVPGSNQSPEAIAELGRYGLGTRRTLEQYYEFSGIDLINHTTEKRCIVKYVPWWTPPHLRASSVHAEDPRAQAADPRAQDPLPEVRQAVTKNKVGEQAANEAINVAVPVNQKSDTRFVLLYGATAALMVLGICVVLIYRAMATQTPQWKLNKRNIKRAARVHVRRA